MKSNHLSLEEIKKIVDDHRDIVLPVGVAAGQYPGTDGIGQLLSNDLQTVLRVLDLRGERLGCVGDLVQVLWHLVLPPVFW